MFALNVHRIDPLLSIFLAGMVALFYGFDKPLLETYSDEVIRLWLKIGSACTIVFSLLGALQSVFAKYKHLLC